MNQSDRIKLIAVIAGFLIVGFLLVPVFGAEDAAPPNVSSFGAPPMVPHQDYKEEACIRCHSEIHAKDSAVPVTPHEERSMCRQCHVPMNDAPLRVGNRFGGE